MYDGTPVGPLLKTVFESILEVFLVCLGGYILARNGILKRPGQKLLNRVNVSLFTPSLLFSKVAFFVTPAKLRELWIIPILFTVTTVVSMVVAYILGRLLRLKKSQRSFAIAAAMFMNSNTLPIALMQSLVVTVPSLKQTPDDNEDTMFSRAITYLVLHSTLGMILRWSYGVRLLSQADPETTADGQPLPAAERVRDPEEQLSSRSSSEEIPQGGVDTFNVKAHDYHGVYGKNPRPNLLESFADLETGDGSSTGTSQTSVSSSTPSLHTTEATAVDNSTDDEMPEPIPRHRTTEPTSSIWQHRMRRLRRRIERFAHGFYKFMTVPLWAALLSLIIACIPPLQRVLDQDMLPFKQAVTTAGNCSIPLTLVVLGAYFYNSPEIEEGKTDGSEQVSADATHHRRIPSGRSGWSHRTPDGGICGTLKAKIKQFTDRDETQSKSKKPGETTTVLIGVAVRMIITPALLMPLFALATRLNMQQVFDDPVFVVSNVLIIASPTALTLAQITQAASGDAFERLIGRTMFWSYCIVTPPSTILFVVIGLLLSKL